MRSALSIVLAVLFCVNGTVAMACPAIDGGKKILMSPVNVYNAVVEETPKSKFPPVSFVGGLLKGVAEMGRDIVVGICDIVVSPAMICKKSSCCMTK